MRRGTYVRLVARRFPTGVSTPDLSTLFLVSDFRWVLEGWLESNVTVGGRIKMVVRVENGELVLAYLTTGPIERISSQYVQTDKLVCPAPAGAAVQAGDLRGVGRDSESP